MTTDRRSVLYAAVLGAVLAAVLAVVASRHLALSALLGTGLALANLVAFRIIVQGFFRSNGMSFAFAPLKAVVLFVGLFALLRAGFDGLAVLGGYGVMVPAIALAALRDRKERA